LKAVRKKPAGKPGKASAVIPSAKAKKPVAGNVAKAFDPLDSSVMDKRKNVVSREAKWVAHWLYTRRLDTSVPDDFLRYVHGPLLKLLDGNGEFFRQVADALDSLEEAGAGVNEFGGVSVKVKLTPKIYIGRCWTRWEAEKPKAKIEVRLALIRERCGVKISKARYYGIVEQLGLKK
jgi:hypothetical protein